MEMVIFGVIVIGGLALVFGSIWADAKLRKAKMQRDHAFRMQQDEAMKQLQLSLLRARSFKGEDK